MRFAVAAAVVVVERAGSLEVDILVDRKIGSHHFAVDTVAVVAVAGIAVVAAVALAD